ncbi:MAG TPA: ABC transporter permease, partial [Bryobacteraceae bacterium]
MRFTAQFQMLLRSLFLRRRVESELDEEFRAHLQQETEENMRLGMAPEQAATRARQLMGSPSLYKEECRDARATRFFEILVRDLRYALRTMRRAPLFTAAAVFTLALAIGANTTVFTFVENILLRPLPVREPAQLVAVNWGKSANISYPNYLDFRDRNAVFSQLAADRVAIVNLSLRNRENFVSWGYEATGNYFQTLGIQPYLGRFFGPAEDDKPNAHPVIVLSYRSWQTHFAADPGAIGRTIKINGYPFTIIGIAPPYFLGTQLLLAGDFWIPMSMQLQAEPGEDFLHSRIASNIWTLGRLKPGISRTQAEAELNRIRAAVVREHPTELDPKPKIHLGQPGLIGDALRKPIAGFG